jgi:hypothetical protein
MDDSQARRKGMYTLSAAKRRPRADLYRAAVAMGIELWPEQPSGGAVSR